MMRSSIPSPPITVPFEPPQEDTCHELRIASRATLSSPANRCEAPGDLHACLNRAVGLAAEIEQDIRRLRKENEQLRGMLDTHNQVSTGEIGSRPLFCVKAGAHLNGHATYSERSSTQQTLICDDLDDSDNYESTAYKMHTLSAPIARSAEVANPTEEVKSAVMARRRLSGRATRIESMPLPLIDDELVKAFERKNRAGGMVFDMARVKSQLRKQIIKQERPASRFFSESGYMQKIARHPAFEHTTFVVIFLNTIWVGINSEFNDATVLVEAAVGFQIVEQLFCTFFFFEWVVRFCALSHKCNFFKDAWLMFDFCLLFVMVMETWVLSIIWVSMQGDDMDSLGFSAIRNATLMKTVRLLRLARFSRAAKVLRHAPEAMVLVKATLNSRKSVAWTFGLLMMLIYFFAVVFTELARGTTLEGPFGSIGMSMHTLLTCSLFPDMEELSLNLLQNSFFYWIMWMLFVLVTIVTVLNLLIGVLVEVVKNSSLIERDAIDVGYVKEVLMTELRVRACDDLHALYVSKARFITCLDSDQVLKALKAVGVDVVGLVDELDFIFSKGKLPFIDLMQHVLQLRSNCEPTVRDLLDLRKFIMYELENLMKVIQPSPNSGAVTCYRDMVEDEA
eukprot:TRINITY_DN38282_c0_g1_i1.p1 TRINITY_DN38282_c0_g1~~TRINITY_DN38282_c0_g1_i1.p1  ORF type:complete len:621 (-),score=87.80 TRINITY_DN38282_c0_g1_i1:173-2035(-)